MNVCLRAVWHTLSNFLVKHLLKAASLFYHNALTSDVLTI